MERKVSLVRNVIDIRPRTKSHLLRDLLGMNPFPPDKVTFFCDFLLIDYNPPDPLKGVIGEVQGYHLASVLNLRHKPYLLAPTFELYCREGEKLEFEKLDNGYGNLRIGNADYIVSPRNGTKGIIVDEMPANYSYKDHIDHMSMQELGGVLV